MDDKYHPSRPHPISSTRAAGSASADRQPVAVSVRGVTKIFRLGASSKTLKERLLHRDNEHRNEFRALNSVSFDIMQGETFGIIGHNGSGKSTLLKLISGIMSPTEGEVLVRGRLAALLELGAGFHPDLTGTENIFLNGSILGFSESYVKNAYDDIVAFAELEDFTETPVKHYSSGMRARLGFAVATHLEPDVLLLDEILAVGDESFKRKCMERVHRFQGLGRTMVLVSHSASTVAQLCERSAVIAGGELIFVGGSEEAIEMHRKSLFSRSNERLNRTVRGAVAPAQSSLVRSVGARFDLPDLESAVKPGQDLRLLVDVEVLKSVVFRVRLTIRTEEGLVLLNRASTGAMGAGLDLPVGPHTVTFTLHDLPLRDGRYVADITVESQDGAERYDRVGGAATFQVTSGTRGLGLVAIAVSCEVTQAGGADRGHSRSGEAREHDRRAKSQDDKIATRRVARPA